MTTPSYSELIATIRREGEAIVTAGTAVELGLAVPTCGDWSIRDLLAHVGSVYRRATTAVADRATAEVAWTPPPTDLDDAGAYLSESLDELVHALSDSEPDTPAWNWSGGDQTARFWARRMAHESAVHRYDAQRAQGLAQPIDADLAADGMDELVDLLLPRIIARDEPKLPDGTFHFVATDDGEWIVTTGEGGVERQQTARHVDVTVTGPSSAVLLACYGRVKWASLDTSGDESLLGDWSRAFRF
ncbi:MAG TPA: maleylpyruvate isomerase family mycothiol-dependent enzyme [Mycobacteriales bacterium]|nr:maleylpyruvate isomerase family mycothiol-dependent enzyme [Mycobacteriales bacterium]